MNGIPLELITMLGSGILGGVMSLWSKSMDNKKKLFEMAMVTRDQEQKAIKAARNHKNPAFQWTRRIVTLAAVFAIVVWPKIVPVFWPDILTIVGWTAWDPGFLFIPGEDVTKFQYLKGLVITPLDTHLMSAIVGMYFGASTVKNR